MESFWLASSKDHRIESVTGTCTASESDSGSESAQTSPLSVLTPKFDKRKQDRMIDWIADLLTRRIKQIVARQDPKMVGRCNDSDLVYHVPKGQTSLDEVAEVIKMPKFDAKAAKRAKQSGDVTISSEAASQLREVVAALADMYQANPFHNFEHAWYVFVLTHLSCCFTCTLH